MATIDELNDSLDCFAKSCNENQRLMAMIKDWNRVIAIRASDLNHDRTLITSSGTVSTRDGLPQSSDLVVTSTSDILAAIFYGELSPNEPYNDGSLTIKGPESDIVKLDFIIAMLWQAG